MTARELIQKLLDVENLDSFVFFDNISSIQAINYVHDCGSDGVFLENVSSEEE